MRCFFLESVGYSGIRCHSSLVTQSFALPCILMLLLSLSLTAGQVRSQCGSLSAPSTIWSDGNGSWSVNGNWTSGTPNASTNACILDGTSTVTVDTTANANGLQLASGNVLTLSGGSLSLSSGTSLNLGLIDGPGTLNLFSVFNNASGGNLGGGGGGPINNYGTLNNASGAELGAAGLMDNFGIINNANGAGFVAYQVNNYGTINNSGGMTDPHLNGPIINYGTLNNASGGDMEFGSFSGDTNFGVINNSADATLMVIGFLTNHGSITNAAGGNLIIPGTFGTLTNYGALTNFGALTNDSTGTIINYGTINNASGATLINSGTINNTGIFANSGAVMISSTGLFTTSTNYTQTAGSTLVNGTLTATSSAIVDIQGGTLGGTGTINGYVLVAGTMMPGDAPGTLTIFGNYEQTGTGIFDEQMSPYSQAFLDVSGNVVLDPGALLDITLLSGYDPLGQTISIMDFSTLSGQFANGSSFWDDGYLWDITYRQHEIDVSAVQAPEPSSLLLLFSGLAVLVYFSHRKLDKIQRLA